ncbi:hypothetical protein H3N56_11330 [Cetobacterium sp. 2A]|nr:hypothetical protein [Cetobacterium sp. 2A]
MKHNTETFKQYKKFLKNIDKCIEILKVELEKVLEVKNLVGIDKNSLEIYVHEKDKTIFRGVCKNRILFKSGEEEIPLYRFHKKSKISREYRKILKKYYRLVEESKRPRFYLDNCNEEKEIKFVNKEVYILIMNKNFVNKDDNYEEYPLKKYDKEFGIWSN